ncbi:MAG: hypothetical protein Q4D80_04965, partial [Pseudomonadota bacterium]|nr:hypothetical protein [Pseudomonadota bacterium]
MRTTFLTEDQIWGDYALEVIKKYGTRTGLTDLTVALGGMLSEHKTIENDYAGPVWTASYDSTYHVCIAIGHGNRATVAPYFGDLSSRPALPSSETSKIYPNAVRKLNTELGQVKICEYGEYPQDVVFGELAKELEKNYKHSALQRTGKRYTFDGNTDDDFSQKIIPERHEEYIFKGSRYVRIKGKPYDRNSVMSDGREVRTGRPYWFEVKPIEWLMDEQSGIWVAKKALFAGIKFDCKDYNGNFKQTEMRKYLDNYFSKEMQNSYGNNQRVQKTQNPKNIQTNNPFQVTSTEPPVYEETDQYHEYENEPSKRQKGYGIQVVEEPLP